MYGQEIHAAVVIKQGEEVKENELQEYVDTKVAKFKIPKKVLSLELHVLMRFILQRRFRRPQPERFNGPK